VEEKYKRNLLKPKGEWKNGNCKKLLMRRVKKAIEHVRNTA